MLMDDWLVSVTRRFWGAAGVSVRGVGNESSGVTSNSGARVVQQGGIARGEFSSLLLTEKKVYRIMEQNDKELKYLL